MLSDQKTLNQKIFWVDERPKSRSRSDPIKLFLVAFTLLKDEVALLNI